ncbi:EAL domain-containing protein [Piscibacillus salipiscarius]|uniref:EAL domain-containing protein n=2 Tax=Piscibacillus salipiscarius TaxID=299480 RepID=A0ABW5Q767_9BACI
MKEEIREKDIYHLYQPIYDLNKFEVIGYEALLRTTQSDNPEQVFKEAKKEGYLYWLDTVSIQKAIHKFIRTKEYRQDHYLFLNVYPSTLINPNFLEFIDEFSNLNLNITLEINESEAVEDIKELVLQSDYLKNRNILLAIDDVGKGSSELVKIIELHPEIIKIDANITQAFNHSKEKTLLIKLLIKYCKELQIRLILEGIEEIDTLFSIRDNGAVYGQGYLLGRPSNLTLLN